MVRTYHEEEFVIVPETQENRFKIAISNRGRVIRFEHDIQDAEEVRVRTFDDRPLISFNYWLNGESRSKTVYLSRFLAQHFLPKPENPEANLVIHLDHDKGNIALHNLKWVTVQERSDHNQHNPRVISSYQRRKQRQVGHKLTSTQVLHIKKLLANPNRKTRIKMIAKKFGISDMQVYRIKRGECWAHVK